MINHRLAFDHGSLYGSFWNIFLAVVRRGEKEITKWQVEQLKFNMDIFEHYLTVQIYHWNRSSNCGGFYYFGILYQHI